jgi:cytochrome c biogenesis protein CcdA
MVYWLTIAVVLIGISVVLIPFVIIAISTSKLLPQERSAFLMLYGAAILLIGIAAADMAEWLPSRPIVDVILLVGGFALGAAASRVVSGFRLRTRS